MKAIIPWFCLAVVTQAVFAQSGLEAYRQEDYAKAAQLFQAQKTLDPLEDYYVGRMYLYGYGVLKSNALAVRAFKRAADRGLLDAQLLMAKIELFQNHNPERALEWFKKAAAAKETSAELYCAGAYLFGVGTKKNSDVARGYYIAAARSDNAIAQQTLAASFLETHQSANKTMGLVWLKKAVTLRDPEAEIMLAELYVKGDLVEEDIAQAKVLIDDAIAQGYIPALYQMGRLEQGFDRVQEAQSWYRKAADANFVPAQIALAELYLDPKSELYSVHNAFLGMLKAAQSGSSDAQHRLSLMYLKGQGVTANEALAVEWEKKSQLTAQNAGHDAEKQMASWLTHGKFKNLSDTEYRLPGIFTEWSNTAALQDEIYNQPPQMTKIAKDLIYQAQFSMIKPNDIPINQYYDAMVALQGPLAKDTILFPQYVIQIQPATAGNNSLHAHREGYDYLSQVSAAAGQKIEYAQVFKRLFGQAIVGDSTAQFNVAQMYQQGLGVEKSIQDAIKFYQMAAAQHDLPAEYQLGLLYLQGGEVSPEYGIAMDWFIDAAFQGNPYAQYALARIYEQGYQDKTGREVVPSNPGQALSMYQLASANNYGLAQYRLAEIMVRDKPKDVSIAGLETRRKLIKHLYQGAVSYGVAEAKLPLAFYDAMDADQTKQAQAFADAQQAATVGSADAAFLLGLMYDRGIATESSRDQAIHWYEQAASNPMAAFILGTYAADGTGLFKNLEKAKDYLQFSANKDFAPADFNLAVLNHQQGETFLPYLDKAVVLGLSRAGLLLADYYMTTDNNPQQLKKARDLYEMFAKQGDQSAQLKLGYLYEQGLGVPQDVNQAITWYTVAAEQGLPKAQYLLGRVYQLGLGGKSPDLTLAKQWYALAQAHDPAAAVAYGFIDEMVNDDYVHAFNEYQRAADLSDPVAAYDLALMYDMGKHQAMDTEKAKELYLVAANQGVVKAMLRLGVLYVNEKKFADAQLWLAKAAGLGDPDALYQLGVMSETGLGMKKSTADAIQYYQQAVNKGQAKAMLALASLYYYGLGVNKDMQQAAQYYKELAQQDNSNAQYQLAMLCLSGTLSDCDAQQGKNWLEKAQNNGCKDASQRLRLFAATSQEGISYIESATLSAGQHKGG